MAYKDTQSGRVTVVDVAKRAGVSHTAVSAAISGNGRISEARRRDILRIVKDMDYRPRIAAQLLRANKTGQLGLIGFTGAKESANESEFFGPILFDFIKTCEDAEIRYYTEVMRLGYNDDPANFEPPHQLSGGLVDGVIVAGFGNKQIRQWLGESGKPWVCINEPSEYSVISADDRGISDAAKHLAALGHRKVAYIGGPNEYTTHRLGRMGFENAVKEFCLDVPDSQWIYTYKDDIEKRQFEKFIPWVEKIFSAPDRPSAVICHGAYLADALVYHVTTMGLRILKDLSVIAFGTAVDSEKSYPQLSSIEADFATMVSGATNMLRRLISGKCVENPHLRVLPKLIMRDTVAKPG